VKSRSENAVGNDIVQISETSLSGVLLMEPAVHRDNRGYLFESFRADFLERAGLPRFVQENQTFSERHTLRGLHYQLLKPQAKLIRVLSGAIVDVAVDLREGSATFGRWVAEVLSAENRRQLFIPAGFAHGFCVIEATAEVLYKCSDYYSGPQDQCGIVWNDPTLAIDWPTATPVVSAKDQILPVFSQRARMAAHLG
jgi:dTDP-4-dehydrorhamnose 3,5-epimerase